MTNKTNTERIDQSCVFGKINDHQTFVVEILIDLEGVGDFCPFRYRILHVHSVCSM
jgi:hypothetical protein